MVVARAGVLQLLMKLVLEKWFNLETSSPNGEGLPQSWSLRESVAFSSFMNGAVVVSFSVED
jgi:hypothetical protein